jgi:uncharacterized protein YndB with AHSA1/START domain
MREYSLATTIKAPPDRIWALLTDVRGYERWNTLIPQAEGSAVQGARLRLRIVRPTGKVVSFRPRIIKVSPQKELVLDATILHTSLLHMTHFFTLVPQGSSENILLQRWTASGAMLPLLWPKLKQRMERFSIFGDDLRSTVERQDADP